MNRRSRRPIVAALAALMTIATLPASSHADPAAIAAAQRSLQTAVNTAEAARVLEVRARFDALRASEPRSADLAYWVAVADWRAAQLLGGRKGDKKAAQRQIKAGLAAADAAIALDPKHAEAHSLRAALLGLSIGFGNPMSGMTVGPKIAASEERARELAPDNPRVLLLEGMGTLHKPGFVGGGADKALATIKRAIERFDAEAVTDSLAPAWGRDDAYVWAGRATSKLGDLDGARAYYLKALEINPEHGWARHVLLPATDKAIAARAEGKGKS